MNLSDYIEQFDVKNYPILHEDRWVYYPQQKVYIRSITYIDYDIVIEYALYVRCVNIYNTHFKIHAYKKDDNNNYQGVYLDMLPQDMQDDIKNQIDKFIENGYIERKNYEEIF